MKMNNKLAFFFLILLLNLLLSISFINNLELSLLLSASVTLLILPLIKIKEKLDFTSPIIITLIYLLFAYPIKFIALRLGMPYLKEDFPGLLWDDGLMINLFLGLTLGLISYLFAFNFTPSFILNYFRKFKFNFNVSFDKKLPRKIFIIYLIGISSLLIQVITGFYTSFVIEGINFDNRFNVIFANTTEYTWYGLIAGFLWITAREKEASKFGNIAFFSMLIFSLLIGIFFLASKTYLIYPVLFLILSLSINNVRIKMPVLITTFTLMVFFTFLFIPQYRDNFKRSFFYGTNKIENYIGVGKVTMKDITSTTPNLYQVGSSIIHRFSGLDITANILAVVPNKYEYFYFEQLGSVVYSLIPRFIYPSKPKQEKTGHFSINVGGMIYGGSAEPTPLGEGYLNFGYAGIILLFSLWGFLQSILYHGIYLPRKNNFIIQVIYVVLMMGLIGFGGWIIMFVVSIFQIIIFLIPLVLILRSKKRQVIG